MIFDPDELIVSRPEFLHTRQRVGSIITFLLFWAIFLFILRPLFTLLGWLFAFYILKNNLVNIERLYETFVVPVIPFFIIIAFMLIIFPIWMIYNKRRFSGFSDKRARAEHRTLGEKVMFDMNVSRVDYQTAISCGALVVFFDEDAHITAIRDMYPPAALMPEFVFDDGAEDVSDVDDFRIHMGREDAWMYEDDSSAAAAIPQEEYASAVTVSHKESDDFVAAIPGEDVDLSCLETTETPPEKETGPSQEEDGSYAAAVKAAAQKASAKKSAAQKAASIKVAAQKVAVQKAAAKKAAAQKAAAQKTAAQKVAVQKAAAKKTTAQKAAAQKSSAQKVAMQKAAAKKTAAQKTAAQKASAQKVAVQKAAAKKAAAKRRKTK